MYWNDTTVYLYSQQTAPRDVTVRVGPSVFAWAPALLADRGLQVIARAHPLGNRRCALSGRRRGVAGDHGP